MSWEGLAPGEPVAIALGTHRAALARATPAGTVAARSTTLDDVAGLEDDHSPRWVWWGADTADGLVAAGIRPARCWDLDAVHRLRVGGSRAGPARSWATAHGLDPTTVPRAVEPDLFTPPPDGDPDDPVAPDGHLRPEWIEAATAPDRIEAWTGLALEVFDLQRGHLADHDEHHPGAHHLDTARSESAAALLAAELGHDGLPIDLATAASIIGALIGPRPHDAAGIAAAVRRRDAAVLDLLPPGRRRDVDLRSPGRVRSLLRSVGVEVPDTRAWRLEQLRDAHPVVPALLAWRKAERIATTFGYDWLDEHVTRDPHDPTRGRLHGRWTSSDGAAGRMTATAGLHNLPAELRPAVAADTGHVLVRADLGQVEPRVLAAVSGDPALARATHDPDLYLPVARALGVDREIAKVAVLGAMYGQTTGRGAEALRRLDRAFPVAMDHLRRADEAAQGGHDLVTVGGRRIPIAVDPGTPEGDARARAAARGRFGRNAIVQGAAAELFKTWAALVRARLRDDHPGASIVLCLHDELLVHAPEGDGARVATALDECLDEATRRWAPPGGAGVRFVADTSVVVRWSDAH